MKGGVDDVALFLARGARHACDARANMILLSDGWRKSRVERDDAELMEGLKLAAVAVVCACITAGLIIGMGEALLPRGSDATSGSDHLMPARTSR